MFSFCIFFSSHYYCLNSSLSSQVLKHPQNWLAFRIIYKLVIPKSVSLVRAWLTCPAQCLDYLKCNMAKTFKFLPYSQICFSTSLGDIFLESYHSIPSWLFVSTMLAVMIFFSFLILLNFTFPFAWLILPQVCLVYWSKCQLSVLLIFCFFHSFFFFLLLISFSSLLFISWFYSVAHFLSPKIKTLSNSQFFFLF